MADKAYTPVAGDFELLTGRDIIADENFASQGYWKSVATIFFRNRRAVVGLVLVLAVIALAALGPLLSPYIREASSSGGLRLQGRGRGLCRWA